MSLKSLVEKYGNTPDKKGWFTEKNIRIPAELSPYYDLEEGKLIEKAPVPEKLQEMADKFIDSWNKAHTPEDLSEYKEAGMEKKAGSSRSEELAEERFSSWADNGKACEGCIFACGDTPMDNSPDKSSCLIYVYPKTKPDSVYLEGKPCKHKRTAEEAVQIARSNK